MRRARGNDNSPQTAFRIMPRPFADEIVALPEAHDGTIVAAIQQRESGLNLNLFAFDVQTVQTLNRYRHFIGDPSVTIQPALVLAFDIAFFIALVNRSKIGSLYPRVVHQRPSNGTRLRLVIYVFESVLPSGDIHKVELGRGAAI